MKYVNFYQIFYIIKKDLYNGIWIFVLYKIIYSLYSDDDTRFFDEFVFKSSTYSSRFHILFVAGSHKLLITQFYDSNFFYSLLKSVFWKIEKRHDYRYRITRITRY